MGLAGIKVAMGVRKLDFAMERYLFSANHFLLREGNETKGCDDGGEHCSGYDRTGSCRFSCEDYICSIR